MFALAPLLLLRFAARVPMMGLNTWFALGCDNINERNVTRLMEEMVGYGLVDAGYRTMVIDDCWQAARGSTGQLDANTTRFPSGMKILVQRAAALGIDIGLYTTGGNYTAESHAGSWGHVKQDVRHWVDDWGVSYIKVCVANSTREQRKHLYADFRRELEGSSHPNSLLECVNTHVQENPHLELPKVCDVWRVQGDISDSFEGWSSALKTMMRNHWGLIESGDDQQQRGWHLPDMIRVSLSQSLVEYQAQLSLYAVLAAPMILSADLSKLSIDHIQMLTSKGLLAVSQDPLGSRGRSLQAREYHSQALDDNPKHGKRTKWDADGAEGGEIVGGEIVGDSARRRQQQQSEPCGQLVGRCLSGGRVALWAFNPSSSPIDLTVHLDYEGASLGTYGAPLGAAAGIKSAFGECFNLQQRGRIVVEDAWDGTEVGTF